LTDNKGRVVDFKNSLIIMTSNIGSHLIQESFKDIQNESDLFSATETAKIQVFEELKRTMRPEFLNRIDEIIMFKPLIESEITQIVRLQLKDLQKTLKTMDVQLEFSDDAIQWFGHEGYDPQFGARPLKRLINREIINELSKMIIGDKIQKDVPIVCDVIDDKVIFRNKIDID
jgi:ATP-dependent Clp protease ATP-binding subunit ClpB